MAKTKIIATIGPSVESQEGILALLNAGMNVARLNFSHGTHAEHQKKIDTLKAARKQLNVPLAIMLDTKGPEIRLGLIGGDDITVKKGHRWLLVKDEIEGDNEKVTVTPGDILDDLKVSDTVLFDDGYIISKVVEKSSDGVVVVIENEGKLRSRKGVNIPNRSINLPAITEKDVNDLLFGCQNDIDIVAASFIRSADHVNKVREVLAQGGKSDTLVIAKIENHEGVENFDAILAAADGIMIARGDLGVEIPLSKVPRLQKTMIRKCYLAGKISITATQMLESMIHNPRPTRAEASDVFNAICDSTGAVMLSGETAIGSYPVDAVNVMRKIADEAESNFDHRALFAQHSQLVDQEVPNAVTLAAVKTAYSANAKAFLAFTKSGSTARLVSRLRPNLPVIALVHDLRTYHQLAISWGITPVYEGDYTTQEEAFAKACDYGLAHQFFKEGDVVVATAGAPFGISGTTNSMVVERI